MKKYRIHWRLQEADRKMLSADCQAEEVQMPQGTL